MAGGITYEGALGGGMFAGKKFYIPLRLTGRESRIQEIEENGGTVVKLENMADILIADHLKTNAPPGSVSWRFIEHSVKKGALEPIEAHRIHRPAATKAKRPVGSSAPTKTTRTPFTVQEENALMEYVLQKEREGEAIGGNKIFEEFTATHPTHTYQSWKAKWDKELRYRLRPSLPDVEVHRRGPSDTNGAQKKPPPASQPSGQQKPQPTPARSQVGETKAVKSRLRFNAEDDKLLTKYVRECEAGGCSVKGNRIYRQLAEEHPHHTYQAWRDRWVGHLSLQDQPEDSSSEPEEPARATQVRADPRPRVQSQPKAPQSSSHAKPSGSALTGNVTLAAHEMSPASRRKRADLQSILELEVNDTEAESSTNGRLSTQEEPRVQTSMAQTSPPLSRRSIPASVSGVVPHVPPRSKTVPASIPPPADLSKPEAFTLKVQKREATKIQRIWRGKVVRSALKALDRDIVDLQARAKGFTTRLALSGGGVDDVEEQADGPFAESRREEHDEESPELVVKCTCGSSETVGMLISCYTCNTLQHVTCYFPGMEEDIYDGVAHSCVDCENTEFDDDTRMDIAPGPDIPEDIPGTPEVVRNSDIPKDTPRAPKDVEMTKEDFHTYLDGYLRESGSTINFWPTIQGRTLYLWDLWHAVTSLDDGRPPGARSWEDVAEKLGFDWFATPKVTSQLKDCFNQNLGEFERALGPFLEVVNPGDVVSADASSAYLEAGLEARKAPPVQEPGPEPEPERRAESQADKESRADDKSTADKSTADKSKADKSRADKESRADIESQPESVTQPELGMLSGSEPDPDTEMNQPELPCESLPYQSSPPSIHGQKRGREEEEEDELKSVSADLGVSPQKGFATPAKGYGLSRHKRVRYTKDVEIPSTPDEKTGVDKLRLPSRPPPQPANLGRVEPETQDFGFGFDDQRIEPIRLPPQPEPANLRRLEPETQDFHILAGFQTQPDVNTTPSQQLQQESDQVSPIPYTGLPSTHDGRGPKPKVRNGSVVSSRRGGLEVVLESTAIRPRPGFISLPPEDETTPKATQPAPAVVQPGSSSPAPVKRRSLPRSLKRDVTPPQTKAAQGSSRATSRQPMPVTDKGKGRAASIGSESRQHSLRDKSGKFARAISQPRQPMPAVGNGNGLVPAVSKPRHSMPVLDKGRTVVTSAKPRQSMPTPDKGKGRAITPVVQERRFSLPRQARFSSPASTAPPPKPSTAPPPRNDPKTILDEHEIIETFFKFYDAKTVAELARATNSQIRLMVTVLNKVEEAKRQGLSTDLDQITNDIKGYWRKKDDLDFALLDRLEASEGSRRDPSYAARTRAKLESRFGSKGIEARRKFLATL